MIEPLCKGKRVVVCGSGPNFELPMRVKGEVIIAANGAVGLVTKLGRDVDVLVTTSYLFRDGKVSQQEMDTRRMMEGVMVKSLWVDTTYCAFDCATSKLRRMHTTYEFPFAVNEHKRSKVTRTAVGQDLRISSGLWAACLAVVSQAREIALVGISLQNGHHGMSNDDKPRDHVVEDRQALDILQTRGVRWMR